ncbi:MAG: hypothetical protein JWL75_673 [Parcubacteria group bacterium]|nr:hypothetical protein [Parcubacteria group bacterium]
MEHHTEVHHPRVSKTTPKDFFLWTGAVITLYGGIIAFFTLIFQYIDLAFPDPLSYPSDPYSGGIRVAMAAIVVLIPTMLAVLLTIRRDIVREPGKALIWVRRWALVFTIFLASATAVIDLITLLSAFFGGDITTRFVLKALVVLLISVLVVLHFLADLKGYWTLHRRKVNLVGAATGALAIMTVIGGFLIIGTPSHARAERFDQQRIQDLQNIQSQVLSYWQLKQALPESLAVLNDELIGYQIPVDPENGAEYPYTALGKVKDGRISFEICASFDLQGSAISYVHAPSNGFGDEAWAHEKGQQCYTKFIDPVKYPQINAPSTVKSQAL